MTLVCDLSLRRLATASAALSRIATPRLYTLIAKSAGSAETPKGTEKMAISSEVALHAQTCRNLPKPSRATRGHSKPTRARGNRENRANSENPDGMGIGEAASCGGGNRANLRKSIATRGESTFPGRGCGLRPPLIEGAAGLVPPCAGEAEFHSFDQR
jgi:hypothetical protein